jgi:PAS domain S-box-containing protein
MSTRILLADDHQIMRQGLRSLLEKEPDLEIVAEARSGQTAVRLARELSPDIVIMDLSMPDLSGVEVIHQILAASPETQVIALSIYNDRRFVVNILKAGASGFVLKDRAFEEMAGAIKAAREHKTYIGPGISDIVAQDYLETLRESEGRFRTIFEGTTLGIALVNRDGRIVESNPALQELLGYPQEELSQKIFTDFFPEDDAADCQRLFQEMVAGNRESFRVEKQFTRRDGELAWGRFTVSPLRSAVDDTQFAIVMVEDITDQKHAEHEIRVYQEQLRSVASELSLTEERERRRLATELHDHVGQMLALAQIKLGALREMAAGSMAAPMDEVRQLIEQTIRYTRSLAFELSPPILYDLGLEAALEWLVELVREQHGIRIEVQSDRNPKPLEDQARVLLFQSVRELLVNVIKHANAKNVKVSVVREGAELQVKIEDDGLGVGISPESPLVSPHGFGLFSIQERLRHLGGHLSVESEPGRGTRVTLVMPLKY